MKESECDIEEAQKMYEEKRKLVKNVFKNIGVEHYMDVAAILHKKYFGHMENGFISKHIMHRALNGSIIDLKNDIEKGGFVYDEHDKSLEKALENILNANNFDEAIEIIESMEGVDFEK